MFEIKLKSNKSFSCDKDTNIVQAGKNVGVNLEHSCMSARCRSCVAKLLYGSVKRIQEELVLSEEEKKEGFILTCNSTPTSNIQLDIEDLGEIELSEVRTIPAKIDGIRTLAPEIVEVILRLPPNAEFKFISGQYINVINGNIKRSYSIANTERTDSKLILLIKKYNGGKMSEYWFNKAKEGDLLRIEGPLGTFFYRDSSVSQIIFLATGTGIAPVKAILEQMDRNPEKFNNKKITVLWGSRYSKDLFWKPERNNKNLKFIPVLSKPDSNWEGAVGYVQEILLKEINQLNDAQVYACGSNLMINSARKLLVQQGLIENNFYSDAFVSSN